MSAIDPTGLAMIYAAAGVAVFAAGVLCGRAAQRMDDARTIRRLRERVEGASREIDHLHRHYHARRD